MTKEIKEIYMTVLKWKWKLFQDGNVIYLMNSTGLFKYSRFIITESSVIVRENL